MDPTAGPLQSLAYDLRKLRSEAGSPTYRALAKSAGYSATTLSEAAGGVRLPTLEVLLAYVGACHGDVDAWRRRWHEVEAELDPATVQDAPRERAPTGPAPAEPPPAPPPAAEVTPAHPETIRAQTLRRRWRPATLVPAAAVGAALIIVLAVTLVPRLFGSPAADSAASGLPACPSLSPQARFTGSTYGGGAHVRRGATRDDPVLTTIPPNCTVGFSGFCVGEKVYDNTGDTPDVRWFTLVGGGVVSSAVIHGNPPRSMAVSTCHNGRRPPAAVDFTIAPHDAESGSITLRATGRDLDIVGFATSSGVDPAVPGERLWRQIALVDVVDPTTGASLDVTPATAPPSEAGGIERDPVLLVASACLGGDGPTGVAEARQVDTGDLARVTTPDLTPEQLITAARLACQYPNSG